MENERIIFKARISPLIVPVTNLSLLTGAIFYAVIFFKDNMQFDINMIEAVLALEVVIFPFCLVIAVVGALINKIVIENHGASSRNPFSNRFEYDSIKWSEVESIRHRNFFGYKYYYLQSASGSGIWIPKKIDNIQKFKELVKLRTGNRHIFKNNQR